MRPVRQWPRSEATAFDSSQGLILRTALQVYRQQIADLEEYQLPQKINGRIDK